MFRRSVNNSYSYRLSFREKDLKEYIFNFFGKEVLFTIAYVISYIAGNRSTFSVPVTTKYLIVIFLDFRVKNTIIEF